MPKHRWPTVDASYYGGRGPGGIKRMEVSRDVTKKDKMIPKPWTFFVPWPAGALGTEGVHRGRVTPGENKGCCGHNARGSGGAHLTPAPPTTPSCLHPPSTDQMVHSHQGEAVPFMLSSVVFMPAVLTPLDPPRGALMP